MGGDGGEVTAGSGLPELDGCGGLVVVTGCGSTSGMEGRLGEGMVGEIGEESAEDEYWDMSDGRQRGMFYLCFVGSGVVAGCRCC